MKCLPENIVQFIYYLNKEVVTFTDSGIKFVKQKKTTVVLLVNKSTGTYSRGLAFCNDTDNFCKKTGRDLALKRAKKALLGCKNDFKNRIRNYNRPITFNVPARSHTFSKGMFKPVLSEYELKLYQLAMQPAKEIENKTAA